ncbi:hypothetical protein FRB99_006778 [Tulasnella sp. 403]|nr:hypothetical protein FRB99_006778 [Tulasnella sp. 403]
MSSFDLLPVELICAIFEAVVDSGIIPIDRASYLHQYQLALTLSSLNRRLRDVALACPSLWTAVQIHNHSSYQVALKCTQRSKASSLRVDVDATRLQDDLLTSVLHQLGHHLVRCSSLRVAANKANRATALAGLAKCFADRAVTELVDLQLSAPLTPTGYPQPIFVLNAPRLQDLALTHVGIDWRHAYFPSLRELKLVDLGACPTLTTNNLLHLFSLASQLRTIHVSNVAVAVDEQPETLAPLPLEHLSSLTLENTCLQFIHRFLFDLRAPRLRDLCLGVRSAAQHRDWSMLPTDIFHSVDNFRWRADTRSPSDADALHIQSFFEAVINRLINATCITISSSNALCALVTSATTNVLPKMQVLDCIGVKGCRLGDLASYVTQRVDRGLPKPAVVRISARDFSVTASVGQRSLEAVDTAMEKLKRAVCKVEGHEEGGNKTAYVRAALWVKPSTLSSWRQPTHQVDHCFHSVVLSEARPETHFAVLLQTLLLSSTEKTTHIATSLTNSTNLDNNHTFPSMMDIPASPPSFSFPRITRRRRNTNTGVVPSQTTPPQPPQPVPPLPVPHPLAAPPPNSPSVLSPNAPSPAPVATAPQPVVAEADKAVYRIRLVPHLESARSLHFEPIIRDVKVGGSALRVGRFTDRATNPPKGNGLNPNDKTSDKVAFRSKVVSRAHAELWVQGKGVFFLKDTKSSSGTFINHMRLSAPGQESAPHILKDGDIIQLGVDYQGGTEEMYRCVKIKVEVGQGREWQGGANPFNTAALKQLRTLQTLDPSGKGKGTLRKTVGDCCICLFAVSVCQSLFIAPCSHAFHYKCIRPLLELHHPGFSCPLCRTFADLEADVEVDENELKAIEDALDEAEEEANHIDAMESAMNDVAHSKRGGAGTADDAIVVDSDTGGSPLAHRAMASGNPNGRAVTSTVYGDVPASTGAGSVGVPVNPFNNGQSAGDEDRQVEDELEVEFDEDDGDERMVSGSADEFGERHGDDNLDVTFAPDRRNFREGQLNGAGPSNSRAVPLTIDSRRNEADVRAEREAKEFADAATPLNNTFITMANSLIGAVEQCPANTGAMGIANASGIVASNPFTRMLRGEKQGEQHVDEVDIEDDGHGGWTEAEGPERSRRADFRPSPGTRGSSSGSNPATTGNSPTGGNGTPSGTGMGAARGASGFGAANGTILAKRKR